MVVGLCCSINTATGCSGTACWGAQSAQITLSQEPDCSPAPSRGSTSAPVSISQSITSAPISWRALSSKMSATAWRMQERQAGHKASTNVSSKEVQELLSLCSRTHQLKRCLPPARLLRTCWVIVHVWSGALASALTRTVAASTDPATVAATPVMPSHHQVTMCWLLGLLIACRLLQDIRRELSLQPLCWTHCPC